MLDDDLDDVLVDNLVDLLVDHFSSFDPESGPASDSASDSVTKQPSFASLNCHLAVAPGTPWINKDWKHTTRARSIGVRASIAGSTGIPVESPLGCIRPRVCHRSGYINKVGL